MDINKMRIFHAVARHGGVIPAANALGISQPAVSNALKRLQQQYSLKLFIKRGRTLHLTQDGEQLYEMTLRFFAFEQEIDSFLQQIGEREKQIIHFGLVTLYERFAITDILKAFNQRYANIVLSVHSGNSSSLFDKLLSGEIDIAIIGKFFEHKDILYSFHKKHHVYLVAHEAHALARRGVFSPEDLQGERMVLKESGSAVRHVVNSYFEKYAITPIVVSELSNLESIVTLVNQNTCLTFLPDYTEASIRASGTLRIIPPANGEHLTFSTYIATKKTSRYASEMATITALLQEYTSPHTA